VLAGLAQGQRAESLAAAAVVSEATVRSQIRSVLAKLGVNSQLEAVALVWKVGWLHTPPP
jgi:DNA-binding CsgD family transcriptional regulator